MNQNVFTRLLKLFVLRLCFISCPLFSLGNNGLRNYNPSIRIMIKVFQTIYFVCIECKHFIFF